ncbi:hypothetical protein ACJMK2_008821 [Sinanodonta woodiana]|uniref:DDE Tnp4 domain-containing protein n=1 Tax=Sinanodonta woodiana TaxID=1069815 RepID=A0ABD3VNB7_SINWO
MHNKIQFAITISPTCSVSFISKAFGGRTSDKVITLRSGFLDLRVYDDRSQLSALKVEQSIRIARVRIHIERAIDIIKNLNILCSTMNLRIVPHSNNIMTICTALSNIHL